MFSRISSDCTSVRRAIHLSSAFFLVALASPVVSQAQTTVFAFELDGAQANACAGSGSDHSGFAICELNADSTQLSIYLEHDIPNDSIIGGHIHNAPACASGLVRFPLPSLVSPITAVWNISPTDVTSLFNGELYLNLHTKLNTSGEIRGQLAQESRKYAITLDELQIDAGGDPRTYSEANGVAICELSADAKSMRIRLCHDVSPPFASGLHVHDGTVGEVGAVRFFILDPSNPVDVTWSNMTTTDLIDLFTDSLYLNLHSGVWVDGEIRGQITQQPLRFALQLDGAQANAGAGTGSDHRGFAAFELSPDCQELTMYLEHDIPSDSVVDGHVHLGAPGVSGPGIFGFTSFVSPIEQTWPLSDVDFENLISGQLYVNVHTTLHMDGEIRGQIPGVLDTTQVGPYPEFTIQLDEAQANACLGTGSLHTGEAIARIRKGGRQVNIDMTHTIPDVDVTLAHIHTAPECVNGPVTFSLQSATSMTQDIWYLDWPELIDLLQGETYLNVHTNAFAAGEIRGQLVLPAGCCNTPGDANDDKSFNIADVTFGITFIFSGGAPPPCQDEADADGNNTFNIADVTYGIAHIFSGGPAPVCGTTGM